MMRENLDQVEEAHQKDRLVSLVRKAIDSIQEMMINDAIPDNLKFSYLLLEKERLHIQSWDCTKNSLINHALYNLSGSLEKTMQWISQREESRRAVVSVKRYRNFEERMSDQDEIEETSTDDTSEHFNSSRDEDGSGSSFSKRDEKKKERKRTYNKEYRADKMKCKVCSVFFSRSYLRRHDKTHLTKDDPRNKKYDCSICHKLLKEKRSLKQHMLMHKDAVEERFSYKCDICEKRFAKSQNLNIHKLSHLENEDDRKPHKCEQCGKRFDSAGNLKSHLNTHLALDDPRKRKFECSICQKNFRCSGDMRRHERTHLDDEELKRPYKCDECGRRFGDSSHLKRHTKIHLPDDDPNRRKYKCDVCRKSYPDKEYLEAHKRIHLEDENEKKPYQCAECPARYTNHSNLARHKKSHIARDDPRKKMFECEQCNKTFESKNGLQYHILSHLEDSEKRKPFECDECGLRCATTSILNGHKKTHRINLDQLYSCDVCNEQFNFWALKKHKVLHPTPGQFGCTICEKTFKTTRSLVNHKKVHKQRDKNDHGSDLSEEEEADEIIGEEDEEDVDKNEPSISK